MMFDEDGNGVLEKTELFAALDHLGVQLSAGQQNAVWARFDLNGGGTVDYGEFIWAFFDRRQLLRNWHIVTKGKDKSEVLNTFQKYVRNQDPSIPREKRRLDCEEFREGLTAEFKSVYFSANDVDLLFNYFDEKKRGFVYVQEFTAKLMQVLHDMKREEEMTSAKDRMKGAVSLMLNPLTQGLAAKAAAKGEFTSSNTPGILGGELLFDPSGRMWGDCRSNVRRRCPLYKY